MYEFNDDNWVETAMLDDSIVATFLLTLNKKTSSPNPSSSSTLYPPFNVHWTVRQRRSKLRSHTAKIKTESRRASPTTPLSWSAATSGSGAAAATTDGNEESSRFNKSVHTSRSKIDEQSEAANANKRSRKKMSRPELLEEEELLLKERGNLKDKLAYMHLTVEKQRANNESLKKIKLDLVSENTTKKARTSLVSEKAVLDPSQLVEANCDSSKFVQLQRVQEKESLVITANSSSSLQQEINNGKSSFLLPDQVANCGSSKLVQPQRVQERESPVITANASSSWSSLQQEINNRKPFVLPDLNLPPDEEFNFDS
ncbi:hypothetical protein P8452_29914 [Trifolium repens]|nr:hypothetical protein P8452_29914 [Trifolium repens]